LIAMTAFIPALEPLVTRLAEFTRDRTCRLLHVRVGPELRGGAVELARAQEWRPENRAPFVLLEHPHTAADTGWAARVEHARAVHARRREDAEPPISALAEAPGPGDERLRFALQLQQLLHAAPAGTSGIVVVLAPRVLEDAAAWRDAIELLVTRPALASVRWIVVESEAHSLAVLVDELGERAWHVDARVETAVADAALADLARGRTPAGPRGVVPPARRDVVTAVPDADGQRRLALRELVLTAALAASRGQHVEAVGAQRRARDLCESAGWSGEATTMELVLAAQLVAAGAAREAETSFLRALERARAFERPDQVATAGFGLGAARTIRGERHTALVAYAEAALAAEESRSMVLAIEGSRLAGQAALDLRMEPQAIAFLGRAVRLAQESDEDLSRSSAPLAARTLASVCRRRGLGARAAELDACARAFADPARPAPVVSTTVEAPPAPAPPPAAVVAASALDEGTALLTLEEIARVHWGGVVDDPSPPAEGSRSWTHDEIRTLQAAVDRSLDEESTSMLSPDELSALRGQSLGAPLPELVEPVPPPALDGDEQGALADALAQLVAQGEGRMVMRRDDLERIRKSLAEREPDDGGES
jgi:hypothetical protein